MTTAYHAKLWAHQLTLARPHDGTNVEALARSIGNAKVDLNPHQIDAALFALRSPFSKGVMLADEVGLGKTIEAGLILAQKWAERRRRILLIVPATLRKQWVLELESKFFVPTSILEAKTANDLRKKHGVDNPFDQDGKVVIASYQYVFGKRTQVAAIPWDLVVIDEAHRLRSFYKDTKTAVGIVEAIAGRTKLLLTATPFQNTLLELFGLVSILDPDLFGSMAAFQAQYMHVFGEDEVANRDHHLRERLKHVCQRTLRRQVTQYIRFTQRMAHTADFMPSDAEQDLYDRVTDFLAREQLAALPNQRRKLITLVLRKLLASSPSAIGSTLGKIAARLRLPPTAKDDAQLEAEVAEDYEEYDEQREEWGEDDEPHAVTDVDPLGEAAELEQFAAMARAITRDAKAQKLVDSLPVVFEKAAEKGAQRKAVIFTESVKTQMYLFDLLTTSGWEGQIVLLNGSNNDPTSKGIYDRWKAASKKDWAEVSSGSRSADMKAAIVEEFRGKKAILLATESAAEGINLQFCSVVMNYDLPWNPQRVEQRIGRCHRYGQKCDVLVVNFINRRNAADQRVFELLEQKFSLFSGVFGASDEVLGVVEDGMDLEKTIADIYQRCRSKEQIEEAFDALQKRLEDSIQSGMANARRSVIEHFDEDVHKRLNLHKDAAKASLGEQQKLLLDLARWGLGKTATFVDGAPAFEVKDGKHAGRYDIDWSQAETEGVTWFRLGHPLAESIIERAKATATPPACLNMSWSAQASALASWRGDSGWLSVVALDVDTLKHTEQHILVVGVDSNGKVLPEDLVEKLVRLEVRTTTAVAHARPSALDDALEDAKKARIVEVAHRNESFFNEEQDRLERRSEDLKLGLERLIKQLDKAIDAKRKEARKANTMQAKLDLNKELRTLESDRDRRSREWYVEQDRIRADHDVLIAKLEAQLAQKQITLATLFEVAWTLE